MIGYPLQREWDRGRMLGFDRTAPCRQRFALFDHQIEMSPPARLVMRQYDELNRVLLFIEM